MGGLGSGSYSRSSTSKYNTSDFLHLDIRRLMREKRIKPNAYFGWQRSVNGVARDNITVRVSEFGSVEFVYSYRISGGDWTPVTQGISICHTPCRYGGERAWWNCPRCAKRCAIVYVHGRHVGCRRCLNLAYPSCNECTTDRAGRKLNKLRERIWPDGRDWGPRPKGMHKKTFAAATMRVVQFEDRRERLWSYRVSTLVQRLRRKGFNDVAEDIARFG